MRIVIVLCLLLSGCLMGQKPAQTVINYTDNSQTVQVIGDNNNMTTTTDVQTAQTSTPQQVTENTTKDNMWIFWLVLLGVIIVGCIYIYKKKRLF